MSFDLHYCRRDFDDLDRPGILAALRAMEHTTESASDQDSVTFFYQHPATGVYCVFDFATEDAADLDELELPDGFAPAGLSVSVNFLRPSFFAEETMPVISNLATGSLWLHDPQEDKMYPPGTAPSVLIDTWTVHNESATRSLASLPNPVRHPYLAPAQSLYWWQYTRAKGDLQARLGDDVFVPEILLASDPGDRVRLVVMWSAEVNPAGLLRKQPAPIPQVFPECDYLMLALHPGGKKKVKVRYASYADAMARLRPLLEPLESHVPGLMVLPAERLVPAATEFELIPSLEIGPLTAIASDAFVDVSVDGETSVMQA